MGLRVVWPRGPGAEAWVLTVIVGGAGSPVIDNERQVLMKGAHHPPACDRAALASHLHKNHVYTNTYAYIENTLGHTNTFEFGV